MPYRIKRIYRQPEAEDGFRVLVDRLWPRGISKAKAQLDQWMKDLAPSDALRRWYRHEAPKYDEFVQRYFDELDALPREAFDPLPTMDRQGLVTLLFSSREERLNNAAVLKLYLEGKREAFSVGKETE